MTDPLSRRTFIKSAGAVATGLSVAPVAAENFNSSEPRPPASAIGRRIALSDLHYTDPVTRSEEGIPIGNGRMGSLVWTTPSRLRLQINRVDVYPSNRASNSFFEPHNDYCGGCAFLDIAFDGQPFASPKQHLSVYDGVMTIEGEGITVRIVPSRTHDVFAIAINDRRAHPARVSAVLRMLRYESKYLGAQSETDAVCQASTVQTRNHRATSTRHAMPGRIALTQDFSEAGHSCRSAVGLTFDDVGAASELIDETGVSLTTTRTGAITLFVGSSASFDPKADVLATTWSAVQAVRTQGFAAVAAETQGWWHRFWDQGSIELRSADGRAERAQAGYHYFLYLMASSSCGGPYPPKFNGMLWNTGGDVRAWGAQHWFTNLSCYYETMPGTGRFELMEPMFAMYSAMFDSCATAAKQQWGSQGIFIPETVYFDGLEPLPPTIAAELQDLYLERQPWSERSKAFLDYGATKHAHSSVWNWKATGQWKDGVYVVPERGDGCYGPTSHIFAATAKVAYLFWQKYEFTLDRDWLEKRAYPMLRGAVEFYRHHPRMQKGADGRYHLSGANNSEPVRGARDTNEDMFAIRGVLGALLRASQLLGSDTGMRATWREFLDHLAPLPLTTDSDALGRKEAPGPATFAAARTPVVKANPVFLRPDVNSLPSWFFDTCGVEAADGVVRDIGQATFDALVTADGPKPGASPGVLSKLGIAAATLGRAQAVAILVPNQMEPRAFPQSRTYKNGAALRNRMSMMEGAQALAAEHLGRASQALQMALLQSNPPAPGEDPVLHLVPALPRGWDASFKLAARGGFVVEATIAGGKIDALAILSQAGARCTLRNPFDAPAVVRRAGRPDVRMAGDYLRFDTNKGERVRIARASQE
ncbi:glycoside hydrolase family 95 protein [Sphingomonas endolithica]|uniref:glycoside hydrolase family 95 protein n=1 Tax=Sphingomonas endolithica TaxID=2972485 RepID=UPI0021AFA6B4|nr:glycoside hydrolase family 95 protein [Sphingomonas sp. ZFBP2030]